MEEAIGDRDIVPAAICLGIAGVDRPDDSAVVRAIMRRIGYKARVLVVNDALVALEAGAPGQPGVVVISGTGSISPTGAMRRTRPRAPAAGATCSATRAAATGSAAPRFARCSGNRIDAGRRRRLSALLLQHFGVAQAQGPHSRGLSRQPQAVRDRGARAVRAGGVHSTATRSRSASCAVRPTNSSRPRCRSRAGSISSEDRSPSSWPAGFSARCPGSSRSWSGGLP